MAGISLGGIPVATLAQSPGGGSSPNTATGGGDGAISVSSSVGGTHRKRKLKSSRWSKVEDQALVSAVNSLGSTDGRNVRWSAVAELLPSRIGKQCRERWCVFFSYSMYYLILHYFNTLIK